MNRDQMNEIRTELIKNKSIIKEKMSLIEQVDNQFKSKTFRNFLIYSIGFGFLLSLSIFSFSLAVVYEN
jgi:hypothetical protein